MKALMFRARWSALTVAAALTLSGVAAGPHGDGHPDALNNPLAAHEHHDGGAPSGHDACDLVSTCGAKVIATGIGALTIYENSWLSALQIVEHPIPNGHASRPAHCPPRSRG